MKLYTVECARNEGGSSINNVVKKTTIFDFIPSYLSPNLSILSDENVRTWISMFFNI